LPLLQLLLAVVVLHGGGDGERDCSCLHLRHLLWPPDPNNYSFRSDVAYSEDDASDVAVHAVVVFDIDWNGVVDNTAVVVVQPLEMLK